MDDFTTAFVNGYIDCALWTDVAEEDKRTLGVEEADREHCSQDMIDKLTSIAVAFVDSNIDVLSEYAAERTVDYLDGANYAGHDLWLSQNGHGTGFWDHGLDDLGDRLHAEAKKIGERWIILGDDGLLYVG